MESDKNIYNKINDIVFDSLARRCSVYIDGLGSLVIITENAKINAKESYIFHKIVLEKDNRGVDIKAHILALAGVNKNNIDEIYSKWLLECGVGDDTSKFTIEGVVLCEDGKIKLSEGLNSYLNPLFSVEKSNRRRLNPFDYGNKSKGVKVLIISIILAVAAVSYYGYKNRNTGFMRWLVVENLDIVETADSQISDSVAVASKVVKPDTIKMTKLVPAKHITTKPVKKEAVKQDVKQDVKATPKRGSNDGFYVVVGTYRNINYADRKLKEVKRIHRDARVVNFNNIYYVAIDKCENFKTAMEVRRVNGKANYWVMRVKNNKIVYNK